MNPLGSQCSGKCNFADVTMLQLVSIPNLAPLEMSSNIDRVVDVG